MERERPKTKGLRHGWNRAATFSYTGNSEKAWHLVAGPRDLPVIEVAFLNGQESPTIEAAEADFDLLGIQFRGHFNFGVGLQDPSAPRVEAAMPFMWWRG